jgi:hypothetical protein
MGGYDASVSQTAVYYAKLNADGSTSSWTTSGTSLPLSRQDHSSVAANGYIYVIGGCTCANGQTTIYYAKVNANGSLGSWATNTSNPLTVGLYDHSSVVVNGYVYVIGGTTGSTPQSAVYYAKLNANGTIGAWSTSANTLPLARLVGSAVTSNGYIYYMGGHNGTTYQSTVYYTSTARTLVGGSLDLVGAAGTGNLADGGIGGNLTANSGEFLGSLSVRDQANFTSSVSVGGELAVSGSALFGSKTDSTTAFQIQNSAGSNLLSADTSHSIIQIGVAPTYNKYGDTWTARTAAQANSWRSVTYGNGLFVAVAQTGTNRVMTSPDGITWTPRTAATASTWLSVTYGNGLFVAVSYDGNVMTSPDGTTWTARTAAEANGWDSVTYGNGLFVAVSGNGTNRVMTSPDGTTWTARTAAEANTWNSVTYGNGLFVAISISGTNRVMTSPDGTTWTARTAAEARNWQSVTYGNGLFVAVSLDGTNRVMTSEYSAPLAGLALQTTNAEVTTTLRVGNATNGIDLSATGISFRGTARPTRRIRLAAEYSGAVLDADGSNNTGVLSSGYDNTSGVKMNYYKWTTASGTAQDYDILIRVPIPQDFSAWAASNPLGISVYNSDTTAGNIQIEITDSNHTTAGTMTDITHGSTNTWAVKNPNVLTGTYTAGDFFTIRLRLTSPTGGDIRVGNITLDYLAGN